MQRIVRVVGESVVMILPNEYRQTCIKKKLKVLIFIHKFIINCVLDCSGTRKTAQTHDLAI